MTTTFHVYDHKQGRIFVCKTASEALKEVKRIYKDKQYYTAYNYSITDYSKRAEMIIDFRNPEYYKNNTLKLNQMSSNFDITMQLKGSETKSNNSYNLHVYMIEDCKQTIKHINEIKRNIKDASLVFMFQYANNFTHQLIEQSVSGKVCRG